MVTIETRTTIVPSTEILQQTLVNLEKLRLNFGDVRAIEEFGRSLKLWRYLDLCKSPGPGVCAFMYLRSLDSTWDFADYISLTFKKNADGHGISSCGFPVAGPSEYYTSPTLKWTNPARLEFINYAISEINKVLDQNMQGQTIEFTIAYQ